jgi:hypothetical protein
MLDDFERPDWILQMKQVLETVNEGVPSPMIASASSS